MAERDLRWWTQFGGLMLASVAVLAIAALVLTRGDGDDGELRAGGVAAPTITLATEAGDDRLQGLSDDSEALIGGDENPDPASAAVGTDDITPSSTASSSPSSTTTALIVASTSTTAAPVSSTTTQPSSTTTASTAPPTTAAPTTAAQTSTTAPPSTEPPSTKPSTTVADPPTTKPAPSTSTTAAPTTQPPPTTAPPGGGGDRGFEQRVIELTNARRRDAGCSDLTNNGMLHAAALGHSRDMATNDYFSHTSQDGSSMSDRVERQGYSWRRLAENIAAGYRTPEDVVTGWMNSSGHRANILNCNLTEIGVGFFDYYWTQNFGTPG